MDWRLASMGLGGIGLIVGLAGIASESRNADQADATPQALFLASVQQVDPTPAWPPADGSVAFNGEMISLLTFGANAASAAYAARTDAEARVAAHDTLDADEARPMTRQERRRAQRDERARLRAERTQQRVGAAPDRGDSMIEIKIRDRSGRVVRVERVPREAYDAHARTDDAEVRRQAREDRPRVRDRDDRRRAAPRGDAAQSDQVRADDDDEPRRARMLPPREVAQERPRPAPPPNPLNFFGILGSGSW